MPRLILALVLFAASAFAADEKKEEPKLQFPIAELRLTNGATFRNVTVVRYEKDRVVLKSTGGVGSLAYSMIPEPTRSLMLAARLAQVPPSGGTKAGSKLDYVTHSDFGVTELKRGQIIADISWHVTLTNVAGEPATVLPVLELRNAAGLLVGEERGSRYTLKPGETKKFEMLTIVELKIWRLVEKYGLSIALIN